MVFDLQCMQISAPYDDDDDDDDDGDDDDDANADDDDDDDDDDFLISETEVRTANIRILDKNSSILITFIGRSQMMGSSKSTVIISCINVHILFSISSKSLVCLY